METSQILEELKISDGEISIMPVLSKRLALNLWRYALYINQRNLMVDMDLKLFGLELSRTSLYWGGRRKDTFYKYLKSISTDEEYAEIASRILDEYCSKVMAPPYQKVVIPMQSLSYKENAWKKDKKWNSKQNSHYAKLYSSS